MPVTATIDRNSILERYRWRADGGLAASWKFDGSVWVRPGISAAWVFVGTAFGHEEALSIIAEHIEADWKRAGSAEGSGIGRQKSYRKIVSAPNDGYYSRKECSEFFGLMLAVKAKIQSSSEMELDERERRISLYGERADLKQPLFEDSRS